MKNRLCGAKAAAIILVCGAAAAAQGVPCALPFIRNPDGSFDAPSKEACASLLSYHPPFKTLLKAASFGESDIALVGRFNHSDNAAYFYDSKIVALNTGKIAKYPTPEAALLFTLAHEIGHAVQDRGGEEAWAQAAPKGDVEEELRRSRVIEAHADAIAADLLEKTGLADTKAIVAAQEKRFSCPTIQGEATPATTHPAPKDRFLHQLKRATLSGPAASSIVGAGPLDESGLASVFDRAGRRIAAGFSPPEIAADGYRAPMTVDDFDSWGRPKTQGLRTAGVPQPASPAMLAAQAASSALVGGVASPFTAPKARGAGFLARVAEAVVEAKEAAVNAVMGAVWFDNPAVEALALKSCGVPKEGGFNEAVKIGTLAWLDGQAAAATNSLKSLADRTLGGEEPGSRPRGRSDV